MLSVAVRRTAAAILAATCAFTTISCTSDDAGAVVVVGADSSTESVLLAEIYSQALVRTGTDSTVVTGSTAPLADLDAGRIAVLPARNGDLLDRWNPTSPARKPDDVTTAVNAALPQGLSISDAADGTDLRHRLLVTEDFATREGARTVAALAPHCPELAAGYADLPGLPTSDPAPVDGCAFATITRYPSPQALRNAMRENQIQVGIVNGPPAEDDPATASFVTLDDKNYALRTQNLLALFRAGIFDRRQLKKLNYVAGELTTEGLVESIRQVDTGTRPADVARSWLDAHGL